MNGSVGIKANKDAYYLSNLLSFNYLYNNINSLNFGSFNVNQNLNSNFFIIKNNLEYVKTYGLNTIRFNSDFKYSTLGEKLVIQNDSIVSQNVNPTYLDFNNFGEFTIKKRDFLYSLKVNGNLKTYRIFDNYGDFYLDFNPYITYKTSSFRASVSGLFGYNFYFPFNQSLYNYSFSTSFKYDISSKVALFALFNLSSKLPNTSPFFNGYLLSDFRNVYQGFIYSL